MSIKVMTMVWEYGPQDPTERFVLLAMADTADDGGFCWPSVGRIAARCCMSERNARRVIRKLELSGWVATEVQPGRNKSNRYMITKPDTAMSARTDCPPGQMEHENRTYETLKPDTAMSAELSITIIEPSEEPLCISPSGKPKRRRCAIPDDWVQSDRNIADAKARNFSDQEIDNEASRFRDHHLSKGSISADWDAAWRTWLSNARRFAGTGSVARQSFPSRGGQGSSIASIAARRRFGGQV